MRVRRADWYALGALWLALAGVLAHRFVYDNWVSRHDLLAFFMPWHGLLGERLSNFDLPGWNPYIFGGAPLLADPESGWMYFPAMVLFPLLQITVAMKALILVQMLIGSTATYSLGRVLGFGISGALVSAASFTFGPFLMHQTECCTVGAGVSTWIPVAFLGVELSLRAYSWLGRSGSAFLGGLAISQILAVWLGQGAALALLLIGGYIGYRGLLASPVARSFRDRLVATLLCEIATMGSGFALAAAGLLPKLAANAESAIAGGDYSQAPGAADEGAATLRWALHTLLRDDRFGRHSAVGTAVLMLAIVAIVFGRHRHAIPFWAASTLVLVAVSMYSNPVRDALFLIPKFEELQIHSPTRALWIIEILPAMLAGAGASALLNARHRWKLLPLLAIPPAVLYLCIWVMGDIDRQLTTSAITTAWIVIALAGIILLPKLKLPPLRWLPNLAVTAMIVLIIAWPSASEIVDTVRNPHGGSQDPESPSAVQMWGTDSWVEDAVATILADSDPGGAGEFLQTLQQSGDMFRYAYYSGAGSLEGQIDSTPGRRLETGIIAILANGRPMQLQLEQISGYNPVQMLNFLQYLAAANGEQQNYHHADLFASGANSQLIDMLNVEYFLVDASLDPARADVAIFAAQGPEVFRNNQVVIYRNDSAFARGWIVHSVQPIDPMSLTLLSDGTVNGYTTAFVEDYEPGEFALAVDSLGVDAVQVTSWAPEHITLQVRAGANGFLVLGEIYAQGWTATVDGESTRIYETNGALRGVAVPEGEYTVEFRYMAPHLKEGLAISSLTAIIMLGVWGALAWRTVRALSHDD